MTGSSAAGSTRATTADRLQPLRAVRYVLRAAFELGLARVRFAAHDSAAILQSFSARDQDADSRCLDATELAWIGWSIATVARQMPWRSDCLIQALAADRWLRCLGSSPELILDVGKDRSGLLAHARLTCHGVDVVGGSGAGWTPVFGGR